jgi:TatA/E family protein of Tat protein translocase
MFGSLGIWEIGFILVLALLLFGPKKLPEVGRQIGRGLGEFRRASNDLKRQLNAELALEETPPRGPAAPPPRPHREVEMAAAGPGVAPLPSSALTVVGALNPELGGSSAPAPDGEAVPNGKPG